MRNRSKSLHVPPQPFDESDNETSESDDPEPLHRSVVDDKDTITGNFIVVIWTLYNENLPNSSVAHF